MATVKTVNRCQEGSRQRYVVATGQDGGTRWQWVKTVVLDGNGSRQLTAVRRDQDSVMRWQRVKTVVLDGKILLKMIKMLLLTFALSNKIPCV